MAVVLGCSLPQGPNSAGDPNAEALVEWTRRSRKTHQVPEISEGAMGKWRRQVPMSSHLWWPLYSGTTLEQQGGKATRAWRDGHYSIPKWILPTGTLLFAPGSLPRIPGETWRMRHSRN